MGGAGRDEKQSVVGTDAAILGISHPKTMLTPDHGPKCTQVLFVGALRQYFLRQTVGRIRSEDDVFHVDHRPPYNGECLSRILSLRKTHYE